MLRVSQQFSGCNENLEFSWSAGCATRKSFPGALAHGIRQGVWNALHRFDAADLRRFAHAAVPVEISLTFTSFTWKYHLSQGVELDEKKCLYLFCRFQGLGPS